MTVKFKVNNTYSCSGLYGEILQIKVLSRVKTGTVTTITFCHTDNTTKVETKLVEVFCGREHLEAWDYNDHKGYWIADDNKNKKETITMKKTTKEVVETKKVAAPKKADKAPEMVTLYTFTGMNLGEKEVIKRTAKTITVRTKGGDLTFDAKTGVQTNAKYVKFANKIK